MLDDEQRGAEAVSAKSGRGGNPTPAAPSPRGYRRYVRSDASVRSMSCNVL